MPTRPQDFQRFRPRGNVNRTFRVSVNGDLLRNGLNMKDTLITVLDKVFEVGMTPELFNQFRNSTPNTRYYWSGRRLLSTRNEIDERAQDSDNPENYRGRFCFDHPFSYEGEEYFTHGQIGDFCIALFGWLNYDLRDMGIRIEPDNFELPPELIEIQENDFRNIGIPDGNFVGRGAPRGDLNPEPMPLKEQVKQLVESNLQVILTGAPGTGKTFTAKQVAFAITGDNENTPEEESHVKFVQFHPGYDYSDFVIGLKPVILDAQGNKVADEQGGDAAARGDVHVSFRWKDGIFKDFAQKAKLAYDAAVYAGGEVPKFVFLIDEINRADLSRVFGELFSLLEEDYRYRIREGEHENVHGITLPNGERFVIPENLYIIGTMNDIDRSVESMDFALRRRFAWREVSADESSCIIEAKINDEDVRRRLQTAMHSINEKIADQNLRLGTEYQLGGAIFAKYMKYVDDPEAFKRLWENHIDTILNEYLRGRRDKAEKIKELRKVYNNAVQVHPQDPERDPPHA